MLFTAPTFLFIFLPAIVLLYAISPRALRNAFLVIASVCFYTWGETRFLPVLVGSIVFNYIAGCIIGLASNKGLRRVGVTVGVIANLALLTHFKYSDFLLTQINTLWTAFGQTTLPLSGTALPLGISFFTFHAISYLVDIYRG